MDYIRINHKTLTDGVLIAASEFDPTRHTRWSDTPAAPVAPVVETSAADTPAVESAAAETPATGTFGDGTPAVLYGSEPVVDAPAADQQKSAKGGGKKSK